MANVRFDIEFASCTDVGLRRSHNQDSHVALPACDAEQWRERGHIFLVADGMGAHAVGEMASKMAVDGIPHIYSKHATEGPAAALRRAFVEANLTIHNRGQANREFTGMGTTATALVLRSEGAWVGHVGDSRVYRVRAGKIEQLSFDHSLVWEMARRQKINPEELEGVPTNVIIRSLGPEALVQVDVEGPFSLRRGDVFALCSDGLSGPIDDRLIGAIIETLPPKEACRLLVHLANLQGGPDNITVVVVRVKDAVPLADVRPTTSRLQALSRFFLRPVRGLRGWLQAWPMFSLLGGILLAAIAIYRSQQQAGGEILFFVCAALFVMAGLLGLVLFTIREREEDQPEPERRPPRVYRQITCAADLAMVQQQSRALKSLENRIRENNWPLQWDSYHEHVNRGRAFLEQDRFAESYHEHSLALLMLLEALDSQRNKEEAFKPLW